MCQETLSSLYRMLLSTGSAALYTRIEWESDEIGPSVQTMTLCLFHGHKVWGRVNTWGTDRLAENREYLIGIGGS